MNKQLAVFGFALAAPFLAHAECPLDPLQKIAGTSWAYQYHTPSSGIAAIGTFKATVVNGQGVLSGITSINSNGQITLRAPFAGRYIMNSDCEGGELLFNAGGHAVQLDFYLAQGAKSQAEMRFVSDSFNGNIPFSVQIARQNQGRTPNSAVFVGLATKFAPLVCPPVFAYPDQSINARWLFSTSSFGNAITPQGALVNADYAIAGIFQTDAQGIGKRGLVSFQETISAEGDAAGANPAPRNPVRGVTGNGSYSVDPGCARGDLMMNTNVLPIQYDFVFTENQDSMYLLSLSSSYLLFGDATRK